MGELFQAGVLMHSAETGTGNGTALVLSNHPGMQTVAVLQVTGINGETITFEATADNSNWVSINMQNLATLAVGTTATANGIYATNVTGLLQLRARISTGGSGSVTVSGNATCEGIAPGAASTVTVGSIAAGTDTIGATLDAGIKATTSLGVSSAVVTSADASTATAVTGAPTSGQKLVIWDIIASTGSTALQLDFEEETSGTVLFTAYLPANGFIQITPRGKVKLATADKKLMVDASAAGAVSVTVIYSSEA